MPPRRMEASFRTMTFDFTSNDRQTRASADAEASGRPACSISHRERGVEWSNMANGTQLLLFPDSDGKETSILLMVFHKMNNKFR